MPENEMNKPIGYRVHLQA